MSIPSSDRFDRKWRACYWGVIVLGCSLLFLFPVWRGQGYLKDASLGQEGHWRKWGSFGLAGVLEATNQAPIWAPPKAYSGVRTSVRWPGGSIDGPAVEIELFLQTTLLCGLVAGCGIALRLVYRLAGRSPDRFVQHAWSTAIGLLLTGAATWFALILTMGAFLDEYEHWLIAATVVGGPIGWWCGNVLQKRTSSASDADSSPG